ncbi:MAG: cupin-like domain-containing protein [Gammaproteobacteria bacterium]|nr:cupin-like domain-containing protein [Gammaproteobacteria bacterium]
MNYLPCKLPLYARIAYWSGFSYLTRYGRLTSGIVEEHQFVPSIGSFLFKWGEKKLLNYCEKNYSEHTDDIPVKTIAYAEMTQDMMRQTRKTHLPLLIKGGAKHWPAMQSFTLDFFEKKFGDMEVRVQTEPGNNYENDGKPVPLSHFTKMGFSKIKDFIHSVRNNGELSVKAVGNVLQADNKAVIKEFCDVEQIETFSDCKYYQKKWYYRWCNIGKVMSEQLFIQPVRSHTLWHAEGGDNYFVGVQGVKHWRLVHPYFSAGMYPVIKDSSIFQLSKVDGRESNETISQRGLQLYQYMPKYKATVEPGDILYVPNFWWHTITNKPVMPTIALTFRTNSAFSLVAPALRVLKKYDPRAKRMKEYVTKHGHHLDKELTDLFKFSAPKK